MQRKICINIAVIVDNCERQCSVDGRICPKGCICDRLQPEDFLNPERCHRIGFFFVLVARIFLRLLPDS